jgi:hypothetical protein
LERIRESTTIDRTEDRTSLTSRQKGLLQAIVDSSEGSLSESILRDADLVIGRFDDGLNRAVLLEELIAQSLTNTLPQAGAASNPNGLAKPHSLAERLRHAETAIVEHLLARQAGELE